ncbi:tetratricopeptide repeat-containing glycosyltransferase family 2 protein [Butyrivibrio sp. MC2013]|uniref:tetratricopeptide repeat-containing glycosyltransferase family 2 protein n=1 Tax=Butyrivibrio sp. MC2013 TaxID=1280686 RepID=UPI000428EE9B|nr:glycosyltransferase family 2 protein [Butyrivibrio sp. MC2013]
MVTVSLCMIVKNEEKNLQSCLDSLKGLMDEIIIVDTGSTDSTVNIALANGAKVYDFKWIDDFAAARNFAFSKAGCDFIYTADADETMTEEGRQMFMGLKSLLTASDIPEGDDLPVDIVQMYYVGQLQGKRSVYNYDRELRPKLFRRVRGFYWINPIHEQIRVEPIVVDSDIEIIHHMDESHAARDLAIFEKMVEEGRQITPALLDFYARELYMAGNRENFEKAGDFFRNITESEESSVDDIRKASVILCKRASIMGDLQEMMKYALKEVAAGASSETCCELGDYYMKEGDPSEASLWYYNAAYEQVPVLDIRSGKGRPLMALYKCYSMMGDEKQAQMFKQKAIEECGEEDI